MSNKNFGLTGTQTAMTGVKHDSSTMDCSTCIYPDSVSIEQVWGCALNTKQERMIGINKIMPIRNYEGDAYRLNKLTIPGGRMAHAVGRGKPLHNNQESILQGSKQDIQPIVIGERNPIDPSMMVPPVGCHTIDVTGAVTAIMERASDSIAVSLEYATWQVLTNGVFQAMDPYGNVMASYPYPINHVVLDNVWDDLEMDTPINDLMCIQNNLPTCCTWEGIVDEMGNSSGAQMYANSRTWQFIMMNSNPSDGHGGPCCNRGYKALNDIFNGYSLPSINRYDLRYWDNFTQTQRYFIPTGTIVIIGKPTMAEYVGFNGLFRTSGACTIESKAHIWIEDSCTTGKAPREIAVNTLASTAPILQYPSCVASIKTGLTESACGTSSS